MGKNSAFSEMCEKVALFLMGGEKDGCISSTPMWGVSANILILLKPEEDGSSD